MNAPAALFLALLATLPSVGCAKSSDETESARMDDTQMSDAPMAMEPAGASSVMATGTVESVDPASGKITIAHGPVAALNWPAMTMAFSATPEQTATVKAGQRVEFEFVAEGMAATITRIAPVQ